MFMIVETVPRQRRRRALRRVLAVSAALLLLVAAGIAIGTLMLERYLERRAAEALRNRFESRIDFASLQVSLFPRAGITGERLILHRDEGPDPPPFLAIARFTAKTNVIEMLRRPAQIGSVEVEGLRIHIFRNGGGKKRSPQAGSQGNMPDFSIHDVSADGTIW
jgi:uncharacterized protein involved in outer membrane biogenesis